MFLLTQQKNGIAALELKCHRGDSSPAACSKHLPCALGELRYRFNRRFDLAAMLPRLGWAAVRTPPMSKRLLLLAEPG